jgi:hypothetical protein
MRQVFTKENYSCQAFINVKFNEILEFFGTVKIRGFDTFGGLNHERVDTVLATVAH